MQDLIRVVNNVQDIFVRINTPISLDLPRIAVVGAQSSGKSSVLESIVGCDFLPRGAGMVTRCPVILQLQHITEGTTHAIFNHREKDIYNDFEEVRKEIIEETKRITGKDKDVTNKPIILKIFSQTVLNLTLVDLPGLIRVSDKDQPEDIGDRIRDLVLDEIKGENCVVLAVSAGNVDMANSDAINLARKVDPEGNRTIGVITKLDIMDRGTDAVDTLAGKAYPLKLGYVGVVCRSTKDVNDRRSLAEALQAERDFFAANQAYSPIKERCGIDYLRKRLSRLLLEHVKACIPVLRSTIDDKLREGKKELEGYGVEYHGNPHTILNTTISAFDEFYQEAFVGTAESGGKELNQGARVHFILHNAFVKELNKFKAHDGLSDEYIRTTVANANALHFCSLIPDAAFEQLIKRQIGRLLDPALKCLGLVYDELLKILKEPKVQQFRSFPMLGNRIISIMHDFLDEFRRATEDHIRDLVQTECTYINSEDPHVEPFENIVFGLAANEVGDHIKKLMTENEKDPKAVVPKIKDTVMSAFNRFMGKEHKPTSPRSSLASAKKSPKAEEETKKPQTGLDQPLPKVMQAEFETTQKEEIELRAIKQFLESYFETVKAKLSDTVPKSIITFFVDRSRTVSVARLSGILHAAKDLQELIAEDPDVAQKRENCKRNIEALEESQNTLSDITYL